MISFFKNLFNRFVPISYIKKSIKKIILVVLFALILTLVFYLAYYFFILPKIELSRSNDSSYEQPSTEAYFNELSIKPDDTVVGDPQAPVTIIIYDSFSCFHCAFFYSNTFPVIKQNYIDRKIAKFVHRDFVTDKTSIDISRLNYCFKNEVSKGDSSKQFSLVLSLYSFQDKWLKSDHIENVKKYFKLAGMSDSQINVCILTSNSQNDLYLEKTINEVRRVASILGISGTPTIFINGTKNEDKNSPERISKMIDEAYNNYKVSMESNVNLLNGTGDIDDSNPQQNTNNLK